MKFGVLQFFSWPERRTAIQTVYERALQRIRIMDDGGFDAVWLAEHHFSTYSVCPSVHLMAMHVANQTQHIRIGTGVSLAAFYHPLRLAEEVALLDNLSGGRINWGAGRGFDRTEMAAFGVTADESYAQFRENVDIVLQAWATDRLSYAGKYHQFDDIEVLPKPLQDPMPVWLATSTPEAITWAAQQGRAILMDPHSTHSEIAQKLAHYQQTLAAAGKVVNQDIPIARLLAIAATDAEAEAVARRGAEWTLGSYANPKQASAPPSAMPLAQRVQQYMDEVIIHGSPARVIDQLTELQETLPMRYLLASLLSHETFMLLNDEVVPQLT